MNSDFIDYIRHETDENDSAVGGLHWFGRNRDGLEKATLVRLLTMRNIVDFLDFLDEEIIRKGMATSDAFNIVGEASIEYQDTIDKITRRAMGEDENEGYHLKITVRSMFEKWANIRLTRALSGKWRRFVDFAESREDEG